MFEHEELKEAWIMDMKTEANAVHPSSELKKKVMEQIEWKNEKGDSIASLRVDTLQEDDIIDTVIQSLKPGMGKAIYIAGSERVVSQQTNYEAVKWEKTMEALLEQEAPVKLFLPVDAVARDVQVYYGFDDVTEEEIAEMAAESERTGTPVVVRDMRPNDNVVGIRLLYSKSETDFEFRIFGTTKSRIHVPDITRHIIEHVTVRGHQAVYVADDERQRLIWAEEEPGAGRPLQYEISASQSDRDWLLHIADSLALV